MDDADLLRVHQRGRVAHAGNLGHPRPRAAPGVAWSELRTDVVSILLDHFSAEMPLFRSGSAHDISVPAEGAEEHLPGDDPEDADVIAQIRELIDMYEPGRDERPQLKRFLAVMEAHKASLEQQRADIQAQLAELEVFEKKIRRQIKS